LRTSRANSAGDTCYALRAGDPAHASGACCPIDALRAGGAGGAGGAGDPIYTLRAGDPIHALWSGGTYSAYRTLGAFLAIIRSQRLYIHYKTFIS
jgi:hypothetical protein